MSNALVSIGGGISPDGNYSVSFEFAEGVDPRQYRARLFYLYSSTNELVSEESRAGLYAVPGVPGDTVSYDDWNGFSRKRYTDRADLGHDSSFDVEVSCEFTGDGPTHSVGFVNEAGRAVPLRGESSLNGVYPGDNLPVNVLVERKSYSVEVVSARYDEASRTVTVTTATPHGFSDGDAVQLSGFPRGEHSVGVRGERYNGTFAVTRLSDTEFSYGSRFFFVAGVRPSDYPECSGVTATRWTVEEYSAERTVMCSLGEALVVWPAHTFRKGDKVTLLNGGEVVARDAVLDMPAPNSFVCRSFSIVPGMEADTVVYAPRTPVSDVPANYSDALPPSTGRKSLKKRGSALRDTLVDNGSSEDNDGVPLRPYEAASFDLDSPEGGFPVDGSLVAGTRKFAAFTFMPAAPAGQYRVTVRVTGCTEVSTELMLYELAGSAWDASSRADEVYSGISRVPLASATVNDVTCVYGGDDIQFVFSGRTVEGWGTDGRPVSLAVMVSGRDGAEVTLSAPGIKIESEPKPVPEPTEVAVSATPALASPGDTVTLTTLNSGLFEGPAGNFSVRIAGDDGCTAGVVSNDGERLAFVMPKGHYGRVTVGVLYGGTPLNDEANTFMEVREAAVKTVRLNERMKPGEVSREVNTSAAYNRDLGYVGFSEITDENSMIQNLYSCILTRKGERLFNPEFGTTIEERIFSIRTGATANAVLKECFAAIEQYEPRIRLVYEQCDVRDMGPNGIYLVLGVIVPGGTVRTVSIPFKNRGRLV